jgi:ethanolaminephosphotransferase
VFAVAGVALFAYNTLDNMDGKQARRTKSSSALGLLFDHGCDSLNAGYATSLLFFSLLTSGATALTPLLWTVATTGFYAATWEEFHVHHFVLPVFNGPDEGVSIVVAAFLLVSVVGIGVWDVTVLGTSVTWRAVMAGIVTLSCIVTVATQATNVARKVSVTGGAAAVAAAAWRFTPVLALSATLWATFVFAHPVFVAAPRVLFLGMGAAFSDSVSKLMVSHVCAQEFRPAWAAIAATAVVPVHAALRAGLGAGLWGAGADVTVVALVAAANVAGLATFALHAVRDLAAALGIYVFSLQKRT